jgi:GT2 family glycosyltransferase
VRNRVSPASRAGAIEREVRLPGGRRVRARMPLPPLTILVHGTGAELAARRARDLVPGAVVRAAADPAAALRAEMRVRGDRYVLVTRAGSVPNRAGFDALVEALESAPYVALAAPDAAALDGSCVLLALARFPQHVEAAGATIADAIASLIGAARALKRAVRAPGYASTALPSCAARSASLPAVPASFSATTPQRKATIVFAAASAPEILRLTLTAAVEASRGGDEIVAVCAASAATTRRIIASYPQVRIEDDLVDPLLADATNRALGEARGDLIVFVADDVLLPAGTLDRLRSAFARVPALGAAFPAVPGAPGAEGVSDVQYGDIASLQALAEQRALERARDSEPIDIAVTPVLAVAREALAVVGGIDPAHGATRRGIADLVLRLRAAGYAVVRCDDALVHRFDHALSHNPAAAASAQQPAPAADPAVIARGFDSVSRVPFARVSFARAPLARVTPGRAATTAGSVGDGNAAAACGSAASPSHAIAVPVAGPAELERAAIFLTAAARAFDAGSPVRVHLLLDGTVTPAEAVARVRPVLAASGKPMDDTVAVRIERVADLAVWRAAVEPGMRVVVAAGHERDGLTVTHTVTAQALPDLLKTDALPTVPPHSSESVAAPNGSDALLEPVAP